MSRSLTPFLTEWREAMRSGDVARVGALVTEDAEFWPSGAQPIVGRAGVESTFLEASSGFTFEQTFELVEALEHGDLLFARGVETVRLTPRGEGTVETMRQRTFLLLRAGGSYGWQFYRVMTNPE